ncbi:uncharacterized protein BKA78DRAFT_345766 [Phyllosticta capitalensis]|uniref:uncharacterized protein n=1 Tax=Phyllosticta capitalensis TaxID=121624 RepID=UPI00312F14A5
MDNSSVTVFDPDGDVRLLVFDHPSDQSGDEAAQKTFLVSSKAMSLASDVWKAMFNGHFREAQQPSGTNQQREVSFPDDDARALEILLNIAHMRYDLVPQKLSFSRLVQVTVATDKYGATKLLRPWYKAWMGDVIYLLTRPGHEEWLWIAWELGQTETFKTLVSHLVRVTWVDKDGCLRNSENKVLYPCADSVRLPADIAEHIIAFQKRATRRLCSTYYDLLEEYVSKALNSDTRCRNGDYSERVSCDAVAYGSLGFSLRKLKIPAEKNERRDHLAMCIPTLAQRVKEIHVEAHRHQGSRRCANFAVDTEIFAKASKILKEFEPPLLDMHHRHLDRQAEILGAVTR